MRWKVKSRPENGDTRVIDKFAIFPVTVGLERRWLERVKYEQVFNKDYVNYESFDSECWKNVRFIDIKMGTL